MLISQTDGCWNLQKQAFTQLNSVPVRINEPKAHNYSRLKLKREVPESQTEADDYQTQTAWDSYKCTAKINEPD